MMMGPDPMIRTEWMEESLGMSEKEIAQRYVRGGVIPKEKGPAGAEPLFVTF